MGRQTTRANEFEPYICTCLPHRAKHKIVRANAFDPSVHVCQMGPHACVRQVVAARRA